MPPLRGISVGCNGDLEGALRELGVALESSEDGQEDLGSTVASKGLGGVWRNEELVDDGIQFIALLLPAGAVELKEGLAQRLVEGGEGGGASLQDGSESESERGAASGEGELPSSEGSRS